MNTHYIKVGIVRTKHENIKLREKYKTTSFFCVKLLKCPFGKKNQYDIVLTKKKRKRKKKKKNSASHP